MSGQDLLVVAETDRGQLADISVELLGAARRLADASGGQVVAVLLSNKASELADALRPADRIMVIDDPLLAGYSPETWLAVLEPLVRNQAPRAVLIGATPIVNNCCQVAVDGETLRATASMYAGKLLADVVVREAPAILLLAPGAIAPVEPRVEVEVTRVALEEPLRAEAVRFEEMLLPETTDVDITQQDVLVAVGRGLQQEADLEVAAELAKALGGTVAASRPIVDQQWLPPARQVGKSGMKVKPKCFIALGISGAPEHVEGMKDSELIIAVNTDPNAPIFDVAHYGVVADLIDVAEALTEVVKGEAS